MNARPHTCIRLSLALHGLALLFLASTTTYADQLTLSTDIPITVGGQSFQESDIVYHDTSGFYLDISGAALGIPTGANIDAVEFVQNDLLISVDIPATLGGATFTERDLIIHDGSSFSTFLDGSSIGIPEGTDIDAAAILPDGTIVFSTDIPVSLGGTAFKANDLIGYDGASFSLYFGGSGSGIPQHANIDGAWVSAAGEILISLDVPCSINGLDVSEKDVIKWSSGSFSIYLDGAAAGLAAGSDIDALYSNTDPSLILLFPFEKAGDVATDMSGNGNHGTNNGAAFSPGAGVLSSNAYQFDWSTQNNIQVSYQTSQQAIEALTIEAWIYPTAWENIYAGYNRIVSKQPGYILRGVANGVPQFQILTEDHGFQGVSGLQSMSLDEWHYLVGTFDGIQLKLYVDGELKNSLELTEMDRLATNEADIFIAETPRLNEGFTGLIDNVALYKRARTQAEIVASYALITDQCKGDFDGDGDVDGTDLALFSSDFGRTDCNIGDLCEGDFDTDGDVDGSDLALFSTAFGRSDCPGLP